MSDLNHVSAKMVMHAAKALAGYAAGELLESSPGLRGGADSDAFQRWQNLFVQCLQELAAAVQFNRPQLLVKYVDWLRRLLAARGVEVDALKSGLDALAKVLVTELPSEAAQIPAAMCREASQSLERATAVPGRPLSADSTYGRLASSYLLALLEGDRALAVRIVLEAAEAGHPVRDLYLNVLLPAQEEAGRMWQDVEINIAEEHFATATTRAVMAQLRARTAVKPANGKTLVSSAVAGNQHDIGLQAVADFFELDGWRVIQLGSDVPIPDLVEAVGFYQADLLGLSVCLSSQLTTLKETIESVRRSDRGAEVKILVGGRGLSGVADLAAQFGADGYAVDPAEAVSVGSTLLGLDGGR
jgi:methanogenic corrinoid protein MtbC1